MLRIAPRRLIDVLSPEKARRYNLLLSKMSEGLELGVWGEDAPLELEDAESSRSRDRTAIAAIAPTAKVHRVGVGHDR